MKRTGMRLATAVTAAIVILLALQQFAWAHCDTLDGPVVRDARAALSAGDVTAVLKWVKPGHEAEIRQAFDKAVSVRSLGADAMALADQYFFETLVRLHREGEGAAYTGLKPAGHVAPPVAAADNALAAGSIESLIPKVRQEVEHGIKERFERVMQTAAHKDDSVEAGREYVEAYVIFTHYLEGLHNAIESAQEHHGAADDGKPQDGHAH